MQTPAIDRLYAQSLRLTNYHTGTTCSPTRAALMTGRHYDNIGVWHTIINRSHLRPGITTLPEVLSRNGYQTALFGKWHLGDNKPMRPQDRGFQYTLMHGGGGVGQTPDYWGNDYFDDVYWRNGVPEKFEGYCTDVWFREAMQYMERQQQKGQPFFCYLALNAPHQPHRAPQKNIEPYLGNPSVVDPVFCGMIANIDENINRLLNRLDESGLSKNTILIFTSDNGTSNKAGVIVDEKGFVTKGFNAGMRGVKAQPYEGGHRVPFFIRMPQAQPTAGKDISQLASCMDVMPTLLEMSGIRYHDAAIEGESLVPYLRGEQSNPAKIYIADTQRDRFLTRYKEYCVMRGNSVATSHPISRIRLQHCNPHMTSGGSVCKMRMIDTHLSEFPYSLPEQRC
jgi:arylsulfatase A-like enzyme